MAVEGLSALELPFRYQVWVDLGDEEGPGRNSGEITDYVRDKGGAATLRHREVWSAAVEPSLLVVVVVLHYDGVGTVVLEHRLGVVPTELVGGQDATVSAAQLVGVAARDVVASVGP